MSKNNYYPREHDPEGEWQPVTTNPNSFAKGTFGYMVEQRRQQVAKEDRLTRLLLRGVSEGKHPAYCQDFDNCEDCVHKCELYS